MTECFLNQLYSWVHEDIPTIYSLGTKLMKKISRSPQHELIALTDDDIFVQSQAIHREQKSVSWMEDIVKKCKSLVNCRCIPVWKRS